MIDQRLIFWVEGELISKFLCPIIPQVGQVWNVPKGDHNLDRSAGGAVVKVLHVEITPYEELIDIDIKAEYTERYKPYQDKVRLSPEGFER